jgi:hypothetical protein
MTQVKSKFKVHIRDKMTKGETECETLTKSTLIASERPSNL